MKRVVLNYLVIAALTVTTAFTSCDKDGKSGVDFHIMIGNFSYYKEDAENHTQALFIYVNKNVNIVGYDIDGNIIGNKFPVNMSL